MRTGQILEEAEHPDYAGPEGSKLREEAAALNREAIAAFDAGDKGKGSELKKAYHKKQEEAAAAIFKHRNADAGLDEFTIDLHGLLLHEAIDAVTQRLADIQTDANKGKTLDIITGAGHHSAGGKAVIKPKVEELLQERRIPFKENTGNLLVVL